MPKQADDVGNTKTLGGTMKQGDLVKYKEPYSKLAYLRKRGMGIIMETNKKESRVYFLEDELSKSVWVANDWLKETR